MSKSSLDTSMLREVWATSTEEEEEETNEPAQDAPGESSAPASSSSLASTSSHPCLLQEKPMIGNGRNTVSRALFRKRELTEFCSKLGEFWEKKLDEFALAHK